MRRFSQSTLPRLAQVDPAFATGRVKEIFQGPLKGREKNIFKGMANSAAALDFYLAATGALKKCTLSPAEREVIQLAITHASGCEYCEAAHTLGAIATGLTPQQAKQARQGFVNEEHLDALAKFALALHEKRGRVSDEDIASFRAAGYNDGHIAEVVAVYALATYTIFFNHVNETELDFPPAPPI